MSRRIADLETEIRNRENDLRDLKLILEQGKKNRILKKIDELELLVEVPDVSEDPELSLRGMSMLNLITELRAMIKNH